MAKAMDMNVNQDEYDLTINLLSKFVHSRMFFLKRLAAGWFPFTLKAVELQI